MPLQDVFDEIRAVQSWQRNRENAEGFAARFSQAQADELSLVATYYPGIRPAAALAAVTGGYRADHPMVASLAQLSERLNLREHPAGIAFGQPAVTRGMRNAAVESRREANRARTMVESGVSRPAPMSDLSPGQERLLDDGSSASAAPPPDAATHPQANAAYLDMLREGMFTQGIPVATGNNRDLLQRARDAYIAEGLPFVYYEDAPRNVDDKPGLVVARPTRSTRALQEGEPNVTLETVVEGQRPDQPEGGGGGGAPGLSIERAGITGRAQIAGGARAAFMGLDAPVQEIQGLVRAVYGATHGQRFNPKFQSDLAVWAADPSLSAGRGFFVDPESEVAQKRREIEATYGQINGHNVTLGRWVADGIGPDDPESLGYMVLSGLVDFGVQVADPSAAGLGKAGKATQARRLFSAADEAAGGVRGLRRIVRPQAVAQTLDQSPRILEALGAEASPYNIWVATGRKWPMEVATRVADDAHTAEEVRAILEPELGRSIRQVRSFTGVTPNPLSSLRPGQALDSGLRAPDKISVMPARGSINAHDQDIVAWEVEASLRNAHASDDVIRTAVDRVARAGDNPIRLNAAIRRATDDDLDGILKLSGIEDEAMRSKFVRLHQETSEAASRTFTEVITHQGPTNVNPMIKGETRAMADINLISELAPARLTMPDGRAIRRLTSEFPHVFGRNVFTTTTGARAGKARIPVAVLDGVLGNVWKPLQLMRAAWTLRVIGEEQVRMAAAGYDSMFRHPASFIAWRTGKRGKTDVLGTMVDEANEFKASMSQAHGGWLDRAMVPTGVRRDFLRDNVHETDRFNEAWGSEVIRLANDPVAREVARTATFDEAVAWFDRGAGQGFKADLAVAYPGKFDGPDGGRNYIELVQRRIDNATGGNTDLYDAIRTGKLGGDDMLSGTGMRSDLPGQMDGYRAHAPDLMVGEEMRELGGAGEVGAIWDRFVDTMFGQLMTNRTNNLSRSPTFKQEYWREAERLIPGGTDGTKTAILAQAREANLSKRAIKRMEGLRATGEASVEEVDMWAKGHALDRTKELLYDMTKRSRWADAARIVAPFGEAWWEVTTRWLGRDGLVVNNPKVVRRFQQLMQGARGEDFGEVMGAPEGDGFFWKNEFGEEVFVIPGFEFLTEHTLGVPVPMTGSVQGLSMFGDVIPGLGPAVQIPVGWILANKPGPQWAKEMLGDIEMAEINPITGETTRDTLLPFGSVGGADQGEILDPLNYIHPWMRTAWDAATNGDGNERQYGTAVKSTMAYLYSTGRYGNTREELQRLQDDASGKARWLTLIRALGQAFSPTAPSPDWLVVDKDDKTVRLRAMAEEYRKYQTEDYETADRKFLDAHGEYMLGAVQSQSAGIEYAVPTTREAVQWVLEHPGVEGVLPHTYGFFAPQGGEFDYSLYDDQFRRGDRVQLDPGTFGRLMANTAADMHYRDAVDEVGEDRYTDDGEAYLAETKAWIWEQYPTWGDSSRMGERPETDVLIREVADALGNPDVMSTGAGQGLRDYWEGRQEVVDAHGTTSDGTLSGAADMADAHQYLWDLGQWAIERHPEFELLFDIVLSRELRLAETAEETQEAA